MFCIVEQIRSVCRFAIVKSALEQKQENRKKTKKKNVGHSIYENLLEHRLKHILYVYVIFSFYPEKVCNHNVVTTTLGSAIII